MLALLGQLLGAATLAVLAAVDRWVVSTKSLRSRSASGTCAYLTTRYPASVRSLSRSLSWRSRPAWLESSSSITARTVNARSQSTKSATFRSNRFRVARLLVRSNAENATCASTTCSGNVAAKRKCIACSRFVSGGLACIGACDPAPRCARARRITTPSTSNTTTNSRAVFAIRVSLSSAKSARFYHRA